jgi:hypothetical protein
MDHKLTISSPHLSALACCRVSVRNSCRRNVFRPRLAVATIGTFPLTINFFPLVAPRSLRPKTCVPLKLHATSKTTFVHIEHVVHGPRRSGRCLLWKGTLTSSSFCTSPRFPFRFGLTALHSSHPFCFSHLPSYVPAPHSPSSSMRATVTHLASIQQCHFGHHCPRHRRSATSPFTRPA